jgi:SAM-dependent methyltransferase
MKILKTLSKGVSSVSNTYEKLSNWGKVLVIFSILIILYMLYKNNRTEGFTVTRQDFTFKDGVSEIYDDFYVNIYDQLLYSDVKNEFEIDKIINNTKPDERSIILDIGSATGHHVAALAEKNFKVVGVDKSQTMIDKAKEMYPKLDF